MSISLTYLSYFPSMKFHIYVPYNQSLHGINNYPSSPYSLHYFYKYNILVPFCTHENQYGDKSNRNTYFHS